jgi:uncharacterized iron-regulated membrane protein
VPSGAAGTAAPDGLRSLGVVTRRGPSLRPRRVLWTVHRWLGLASGAVVFVIALTGAMYAFAPEITDLYLYRHARVAPPVGARPLSASTLVERGEAAATRAAGTRPPGTKRWLTLSVEPDRSAVYTVAPTDSSAWYEIYVDRYRGEVLLVRDMRWDPLGLILRAHQTLLLPPAIGRRVIGVAVLVFVPSLVTGLVLWFPRRPGDLRRSAALRQRLTIDLGKRFFRVTYDLHRVLGAYALVVALILALTGLVWSFAWMDRTMFWIATGGGRPGPPAEWRSGVPGPTLGDVAVVDRALDVAAHALAGFVRLDVAMPDGPTDALSVCATPARGPSYRTDCLWFDRHTARQIGAEWYRDKNAGERLRAMNYDIHVGRIAGLPGRLATCAASLVVATLPVTGALLWWNRPRAPRAGGGPPAARSR